MSKTKKKAGSKNAAVEAPKRKRVVLKNLTDRIVSFDLTHEQYCASLGSCTCTVRDRLQKEKDPKKRGATRLKLVQVRTPISITLIPREETKPMDAAVLQCPGVLAAVPAKISAREV